MRWNQDPNERRYENWHASWGRFLEAQKRLDKSKRSCTIIYVDFARKFRLLPFTAQPLSVGKRITKITEVNWDEKDTI